MVLGDLEAHVLGTQVAAVGTARGGELHRLDEPDNDVPVEKAPLGEVRRLTGFDPDVDHRLPLDGGRLNPVRLTRRGDDHPSASLRAVSLSNRDTVLAGRQVLDEGLTVVVGGDDYAAGRLNDRVCVLALDLEGKGVNVGVSQHSTQHRDDRQAPSRRFARHRETASLRALFLVADRRSLQRTADPRPSTATQHGRH